MSIVSICYVQVRSLGFRFYDVFYLCEYDAAVSVGNSDRRRFDYMSCFRLFQQVTGYK